MIEFPLRPRIDLNRGWEFTLGKVDRKWLRGDGSAAETIDLPHCWNRDDTYQFDRTIYQGHGAYRRWITLPEDGSSGTWRLQTHGFYGLGELWLNGRRLARFDGQYLGLDIPLPPDLGAEPQPLAIRLDNRYHRNVLPGKKEPDFLLYGGLAGGAWLEQIPRPHIEERTVEIICRTNPDGSELVELRAAVADSHGAAAGGRLHWRIIDEKGMMIARADSHVASGWCSATATIPAPRCWSPDHPQLYQAEGRLESDAGVIDVVRVRFGITRMEFRPHEGLFLDGEHLDLRGANRHESIPGLGSALTPELHRADAELLKGIGANLVRLSHYPQHPAFLDACDELGLMVYPEIASWKSVTGRRGWRKVALRQFEGLVTRDRHRPSILLWGMGNESRSRRAYLEMRDLGAVLDPDRPVSYAENHLHRARRHKTVGIPHIWSTNYELDVLDDARDAAEWKLVLLSECCNHPRSVRGDEIEELTQLAVIEHEWEIMDDRSYLVGHAVWSLADYATEHRGRIRRQAGLFDAWRQPKMAAELFRARYANDAFISIRCVRTRHGAPASRFRSEIAGPHGGGSTHRLHVFSNCGDLRILQDGELLASLESTIHTVIPVVPGRGSIEVEGSRDGIRVTSRWDPPGDAVAIRIRHPARGSTSGRVLAIDLRIVDRAGRIASSWNGHVRIRARGGVRALTYTADGDVLVTRGEGRVYIAVEPGSVEPAILAEAAGLDGAELILDAPTD